VLAHVVTREAYALDLRQYASWCQQTHRHYSRLAAPTFGCFARDKEAHLCTIAGFYKYAVEEELLDHSPAAEVLAVQLDCPAVGVTDGVLAQSRSHRPIEFAGIQRDQHPPQRACTGRDEDQAGQIPASTPQGQQFLGQAGRD
jgi:hypothetical protein